MRTELRIDNELTRVIGVDVDLLGQLNIGSGETFGASVAATFGFFVWRISAGVPFEVVQSETFTVLAVCQWFNVLNCRSERGSTLNLGILKNPWLLAGRCWATSSSSPSSTPSRSTASSIPNRYRVATSSSSVWSRAWCCGRRKPGNISRAGEPEAVTELIQRQRWRCALPSRSRKSRRRFL